VETLPGAGAVVYADLIRHLGAECLIAPGSQHLRSVFEVLDVGVLVAAAAALIGARRSVAVPPENRNALGGQIVDPDARGIQPRWVGITGDKCRRSIAK